MKPKDEVLKYARILAYLMVTYWICPNVALPFVTLFKMSFT